MAHRRRDAVLQRPPRLIALAVRRDQLLLRRRQHHLLHANVLLDGRPLVGLAVADAQDGVSKQMQRDWAAEVRRRPRAIGIVVVSSGSGGGDSSGRGRSRRRRRSHGAGGVIFGVADVFFR